MPKPDQSFYWIGHEASVWCREGHVTRFGPMRVRPETSAGNTGRRQAFPIGFAKLWERELGDLVATFPSLGNEAKQKKARRQRKDEFFLV